MYSRYNRYVLFISDLLNNMKTYDYSQYSTVKKTMYLGILGLQEKQVMIQQSLEHAIHLFIKWIITQRIMLQQSKLIRVELLINNVNCLISYPFLIVWDTSSSIRPRPKFYKCMYFSNLSNDYIFINTWTSMMTGGRQYVISHKAC